MPARNRKGLVPCTLTSTKESHVSAAPRTNACPIRGFGQHPFRFSSKGSAQRGLQHIMRDVPVLHLPRVWPSLGEGWCAEATALAREVGAINWRAQAHGWRSTVKIFSQSHQNSLPGNGLFMTFLQICSAVPSKPPEGGRLLLPLSDFCHSKGALVG